MAEIFFVIKGFLITILLTVLLQVKVGKDTLETRAERWLQTSFFGEFAKDTAAGASKLIKEAYRWTQDEVFGSGQTISGRAASSEAAVKGREHQIGPVKIMTKQRDQ